MQNSWEENSKYMLLKASNNLNVESGIFCPNLEFLKLDKMTTGKKFQFLRDTCLL